ncbi:MAG: hypothetical protein AB1405_07645, partial [Bdellovibrionota bacterium]
MNKGYGFLSPRTIGTLAVALLALFGTGACSRGERTVNATLSFPAAIEAPSGPGGSALVVFVRVEAVAAEEAGNPEAPILTSLQLPAAVLQDPECMSYSPKSGKSEKGPGFATCKLNMPFPIPDAKDLEIRVRLFVSDPCPGCYGTALWTHVYYGSAIYYAQESEMIPASRGLTAPSCDELPGGDNCTIQLYDWNSASAPEGSGYGDLGGVLEIATESNAADERCDPRDTPVPAEHATVVAYDAQTNVPLAIINAIDTSLPLTDNSSDDDDGEYYFSSLLPVGREVRLYAHFTGGLGYSTESVFSFQDTTSSYYSVGPDGFDVGSYVPVGNTSYPPRDSLSNPITDANLTMGNCPPRTAVNVRFFEQLGYPENPAAGLVSLPLGTVNDDSSDGSLFGAANDANVDFSIRQCTIYGNCGDTDAATLSIDAEHAALFSSGGPPFDLAVPSPFASFIGSKAFPTWTIPGLSFFGVPNHATTEIYVYGLTDPDDPGPDLFSDSPSPFSNVVEAYDGTYYAGVELFNAVLAPGGTANVDVIIHRPPPATACGVDLQNNVIFINHPYASDPYGRYIDIGYFHDLGIIVSKDAKGASSFYGETSCDWYSGAGVPAPFNVPHYECSPGPIPEGGSYEIAVRERSEVGGWGSAIATLDCDDVTTFYQSQELIAINPASGAVTVRGPIPALIDAIVMAPATADSACAGKLYAADGLGGYEGNLYELDPVTGGIIENIGPIQDAIPNPYAITGLAIDPSNCTLYATTPSCPNYLGCYGYSDLLTINTTDAVVTVIDPIYDYFYNDSYTVPDIEFVGDTLLGFTGNNELIEIDPATAEATYLGYLDADDQTGNGLGAVGTALFASPEGSAGSLYRVNAANGTSPGKVRLTGGTGCPVTSLTNVGGILLGVQGNVQNPDGYGRCSRGSAVPYDWDQALVSIDTNTGFVKWIGDVVTTNDNPDALAYAPNTAACVSAGVADKLFGAESGDTNGDIFEIDITDGSVSNSVAMTVLPSGFIGVSAMAFHPTSCTLFAVDNADDLYTINPSTGVATLVGALGLGRVTDIAFNAAGNLFGLTSQSAGTELISINTSTGVATVQGANNPGGGFGGNGLEFLGTTLYAGRNGTWGELDTLNSSTGAVTATDVFLFGGGSVNGCQIMALTNVNGTLYGIQKDGNCTPV